METQIANKDTYVYFKVMHKDNFIIVRSTKQIHQGVFDIFHDANRKVTKANLSAWEYGKIKGFSYEIDTQEELDIFKSNTQLIKKLGL